MASLPRLLVGLGNPRPHYKETRHNIGRDFIDYLSRQTKSSFDESRQAETFRLSAFFDVPLTQPLFCVRLLCYMNESGGPIRGLMESHGIKADEILVLVDDMMIPFGSLRLRPKGSSGGHNGLKSIIEVLGTEEFGRLRLGVGPVPEGEDPGDFVLNKFTKQEQKNLPDLYSTTVEGLKILLQNGYDKAMGKINGQSGIRTSS